MKLNPFMYRGFDPSRELDDSANGALVSALILSPNDAIPFGYIVKDRSLYRGHLEICSSHGIFSAYASSTDPVVVVEKLKGRILKQLKRWRKSRYSPPGRGQAGFVAHA
ncbi:MAG TPA: hypothetical protein VFV50_19255 [Bdellovibrionales bacterium]|nr:hypothetical protein [Bdellovibrionales bacterium]